MIKSSEQKIKEYLQANPTATKDEVISKVFYGYLGNGKTRKAIDKLIITN